MPINRVQSKLLDKSQICWLRKTCSRIFQFGWIHLIVHLTLCHEGLGLICLDIDGIHHAQWVSGLPGFGRWNVQRFTSIIFIAIESRRSKWWDMLSVEQRKINELIE